jgi:hypothetical protein
MGRPVIEMASGDEIELNFKAVDETGAAINLSAFTDIDIGLFATDGEGDPTGADLLAENIAGAVDLVSSGTTGLFKVALVAADTASLSGDYYLEIRLEDASNFYRTCTPLTLRIHGDLITS